MEEQLSLGK